MTNSHPGVPPQGNAYAPSGANTDEGSEITSASHRCRRKRAQTEGHPEPTRSGAAQTTGPVPVPARSPGKMAYRSGVAGGTGVARWRDARVLHPQDRSDERSGRMRCREQGGHALKHAMRGRSREQFKDMLGSSLQEPAGLR